MIFHRLHQSANHIGLWRPTTTLRLVALILVMLAVVSALLMPMQPNTRLRLIAAAATGLVYAFLVWSPFLPGGRTLIDIIPSWVPVLNTLYFGGIIYLFYDLTPMVAAVYLLPIVGTAIRRGLRLAVWSALLASLGYMSVFVLLGAPANHNNDSILFIIVYWMIALFIGSLAQTLQRHTLEYENLVTHSHEAILILDADGRMEFLNPAASTLSGASLAELRGRRFLDMFAEPDRANATQVWNAMQNGIVSNEAFIVHLATANKIPRILAVTLAPLNTQPPRWLAIGRDITAQETDRAEHERRHRELEAERNVTQAISQTLEMDLVLNVAIEQAMAALQADIGAIYLADEAQTKLTLAASRNLPEGFATQVAVHQFGVGITGKAAQQRQAIRVANLNQDPRAFYVPTMTSPLAQISAPLLAQDRVIGVLNVNNIAEGEFSDDDVALLRAIASSITVAIDRVRLIETLEERVAARTIELASLNRIAVAANQSLDLDTVLNAALIELTNALCVPAAWVSLVDHARGILHMRAEHGLPKSITEDPTPLHLGEGLSGRVAQDGQTRVVNVVDMDIPTRDRLLFQGLQSLCAVPLIVTGRVVGALGLASDRQNRFDEAAIRWLTAVGNTIAVAVNNVQLYETAERKAEHLENLRKIDRTLNSMLDLEPMLEAMLDAVAQIVPHERAVVLLRDGELLRAVALRGIDPRLADQFTLAFPTNSKIGKMTQDRAPFRADISHTLMDWTRFPGIADMRSFIGVLLVARDEIIGHMGLFNAKENAFTQEHTDLLLSFSNHAAIAIANARLRAQLHEQARHDSLTLALNHGALLQDLRAAFTHAQQERASLAFIMLDLDNFKQYNDTYGHAVGDAVLSATVSAIRAHIKRTDFVGRWGGEEFGIALPDTDTRHALLVAERIRQTLATTQLHDRNSNVIPPPTASQGIAALGDNARTLDDLIEQADRALYRAKSRGRDQVTVAE